MINKINNNFLKINTNKLKKMSFILMMKIQKIIKIFKIIIKI